ncbi:DUF1410 domain-containing protein [Mesomycoplasma molare]|uniref:DUF1410 domain-containing protein n=1 Tax=Mesomycoplasma molare TaxID=171288 RepID=A0ABY5TX12_9BACT|nr:DUF1410 domain-containing protein [Mesomycoplasma molare]UWD34121.1 DUF1410 domain-containing protein [Mesomycoplasma molare]
MNKETFSFDTSSLPNPGDFNLEKIVNENDEDILDNNSLSNSQKINIKKPEVNSSILEDGKGARDLKLNVSNDLIGKEIEATFTNSKGKKIKTKATVDANGDLIFDTSNNNVFPEGETYTLSSLTDENDNKVVNISNLEKPITLVKTGNKSNGKLVEKADGSKELQFDLPENSKANGNIARFIDVDGNIVEVEGTINSEGKLVIDLSSPLLNPDKIYTLESVVNKDTSPETIIVSKDDLPEEIQQINDDKEEAKKIIFRNWNISDLATTKASIEIAFADENNLISQDSNFVLTIAKKEETESKKSIKAKVNLEKNKLFFDFTELESNTYYIFDSIKPEFTNNNISFLNELANSEFKTPEFEVAVWSNFSTTNVTNNSVTLNFEFDESNSNPLTNEEQITVHYVKINNDGTESDEMNFIITKQSRTHNLESLSGNTLYVVKRLSIQKNEVETNLFKNDVTKLTQEFSTNATPIDVLFDLNDEVNNIITHNQVRFMFGYTDNDQKLEVGNPVELVFKKVNSEIELKTLGRVVENNKISINVDNLEANTRYTLVRLTTTAKNKGSAHVYSFNEFPESSTFETKNERFEVSNVRNYEEYNGSETTRKFVVSLNRQGIEANNKNAKIIFRSQTDGVEVESDVLNLGEGIHQLTFTLDNLTRNRKYIFDRLVYGENSSFNKRFLNDNALDFSFITTPGVTNSILEGTVNSIAQNIATIKVKLASEDKVLEVGQEVEITVGKKENRTSDTDVKLVSRIELNNDEYFVTFNLENLTEFTDYNVYALKFVNKPSKAYENINATTDNLINLPESIIEFKTKLEPKVETESVITLVDSNTRDENARGKRILELSYDIEGTWTNVDLPEDLIDNSLENKGINIVYSGSASLKDGTTGTDSITASDIDYDKASKTIRFKLKGAKAAYTYNLQSFTFSQYKHSSTTTEKTDKVIDTTNARKESHIAVGYGWEYLAFDAATTYWPNANSGREDDTVSIGFQRGIEANDFIRMFNYIKFKTPTQVQTNIGKTPGEKWLENLKSELTKVVNQSSRLNKKRHYGFGTLYAIQLGRKWEDEATLYIDRMKANADSINKYYKPILGGMGPDSSPLARNVMDYSWKFAYIDSYLIAIDNIIEHVQHFETVPEDQINNPTDTVDTVNLYSMHPSGTTLPANFR